MRHFQSFDELKLYLIKIGKELNRIPLKEEIAKNKELPNPSDLRKIFKENGYKSYVDFYEENGFAKNKKKGQWSDFNFMQLCQLWDDYYEDHRVYPNSSLCSKEKDLPSWNMVKSITGNRYEEFCNKYSLNTANKNLSYGEYCDKFKEVCKREGKVLNYHEVSEVYKLPTVKWYINNCPEKINSYNEFLEYLELKPKLNISKNMAIKLILKMKENLNRNLMYDDFRNPQNDEIGISTIKNHWGTFNNMMIDLGFEINQENMLDRQWDTEEILEEMDNVISYLGKIPTQREMKKYLSNVSLSTIHNKIGYNEALIRLGYNVNKTNDALYLSNDEIKEMYVRAFNKYGVIPYEICRKDIFDLDLVAPRTAMRRFNCSWNEFVEMLGFTPHSRKFGYNPTVDGEDTYYSKMEKLLTDYMVSKNIEIISKEPFYRDFISAENIQICGLKRADWIIKWGNKEYIVEYFGLKGNDEYDKRIDEKLNIIKKDNKENMFIPIYPKDLKRLDEIFSFLHT